MIPGERETESFAEYSLYIHVPFCRSFCDYCDFYSILLDPSGKGRALAERYVDTLTGDARRLFRIFPPSRLPTLYIGGGTPPVLGPDAVGRLLAALNDLLPPAEDREWTLEANPESLDRAFLQGCREGGINRLSLGIQSFSPRSRALVHREGGVEAIEGGLDLAAEFFPANFSVDLMTGLPGQDSAVLLGDIEKVLDFRPAHVSLYALTPEEGTPLWDRRGELAPRETADSLWITGRDALERAGYEQYEVSNFSLPGKESRHNLRYWMMENWLALGPSGSGTLIEEGRGTGLRFTWPADLESWFSSGGPSRGVLPAAETLDRLTLMKESLLMGFRCTRGPEAGLFARRFGLSLEDAVPQTLAKYRDRGLVVPGDRGEGCALSKEGLLFLDPFLVDAFGELDYHFSMESSSKPG